jgi:hypothetical protein
VLLTTALRFFFMHTWGRDDVNFEQTSQMIVTLSCALYVAPHAAPRTLFSRCFNPVYEHAEDDEDDDDSASEGAGACIALLGPVLVEYRPRGASRGRLWGLEGKLLMELFVIISGSPAYQL